MMLKDGKSLPTGYNVDATMWEQLGLNVDLPDVKPDSELGWLGITLMSRVDHEEELQDIASFPATKHVPNTASKWQFATHSWTVYCQMISETQNALQEEPGSQYQGAVAGAYRAVRDWLEGEELNPFTKRKLGNLARYVSSILLEEEGLHFSADTG